MGPATALATLSSQPDPLALGYSSRDSYFECARTAGAGDGDRAPAPAVRILHGEHDLGLLVSPGGATPGRPPPATEHPTQKVIDVEIDARKPRRDPDIFVAGGGAPGPSAAASPARADVSGSTSGGTWRKSGPKTSYRRRLSGSERTS